jgi:NAD+ kinase
MADGQQPKHRFEKIAFVSAGTPDANAARDALVRRHGYVDPENADVVVALGGDGVMLQVQHRFMGKRKPVYGMNLGSVGFLMNEYREGDLQTRLDQAEASIVHPLLMTTTDRAGAVVSARAINEVYIFRRTYQTAKMRILVDGTERLAELVADGLLVATPVGSTAYNLSAHGPILPLDSAMMALTPISSFRPRRWRGALLSDRAHVRIEILEAEKRPVAAVADHFELKNVIEVEVAMDHATDLILLHDPGLFNERNLEEQFGF